MQEYEASAGGTARDCASEASRGSLGIETCGKNFYAPGHSNALRLVLRTQPRPGRGFSISFERQTRNSTLPSPAGPLNPPSLPVRMLEVLFGFGAICRARVFCVPFDFFAGAKSHVAQQARFGQQRAVAEMARRRPAGFARLDPFAVMADGIRDGRRGRLEIPEILFLQQ